MVERAAELDARDPLAALREAFDLAPGSVYLDGNSLGPLPHRARRRLQRVVDEEWGRSLITSWNDHGWIDLPVTVGEKIATLVGAAPGQVVCTDTVSVNLSKLLSAALELRPGRTVILSEEDNFPTDLYMAQALERLLGSGRCELRTVARDEIESALGPDVAVLMLTQVDFRTGALHPMRRITERAHAAGALTLWDLAHSAGVVPIELDAWGVDLAVGCGYKFLNGGPGAPAFLYVAERHQDAASQPLTGWMGHASPFDFSPEYVPAEGARRFLSGTPGILGMSALDAALDLFGDVTIAELREKSLGLTGLFIDSVAAAELPSDLVLLTPEPPEARGSQVSLSHPEGWGISQALIEAGVIVDFRAPDIIRLGFSPMHNRYQDVAAAVAALEDVVSSGRYREERFAEKRRVT